MSEYIVIMGDERESPFSVLAKLSRIEGYADVREKIVRCRDCIYYTKDLDPIDPGWPMMCERTGNDMVEPYGFCAWGMRKMSG